MADSLNEPPLSTRAPSASTLDARSAVAHEGGGLVSRLQMVIALLVGLLLVSVPLYFWRRPGAEDPNGAATASTLTTTANPLNPAAGVSAAPGAANTAASASTPLPAGLTLSEVKQLACLDKSKPAQDCDVLIGFNDAFKRAIATHVMCMPDGTTGTIEFVAEVNFQKKRISVTTPEDGRTVKKKVAAGCAGQVKRELSEAFPLADVKHDHGRYRHSVVATFAKPAPAPPQ